MSFVGIVVAKKPQKNKKTKKKQKTKKKKNTQDVFSVFYFLVGPTVNESLLLDIKFLFYKFSGGSVYGDLVSAGGVCM